MEEFLEISILVTVKKGGTGYGSLQGLQSVDIPMPDGFEFRHETLGDIVYALIRVATMEYQSKKSETEHGN